MFKKGIVFGILFIFIAVVFPAVPMNVSSTIITVPDDYTSIQAAINAASSGDTVYVKAGTYYENVHINKQIYLVGEDKNTTIIDAGGTGTVVYITAEGVEISGLTCKNSGKNYVDIGILIRESDNCRITDCIISNNYDGIVVDDANNTVIDDIQSKNNAQWGVYVHWSSPNTTIKNSNLSDNRHGIEILGDDNIFENNYLSGNINGIHIRYNLRSTITKNTCNGNTGFGIVLLGGYHRVTKNDFSNNRGGMALRNSHNNTIKYNLFNSNSHVGIWLAARGIYSYTGSNNNLISNNEINYNNDMGGIWILKSKGNVFTNNQIKYNSRGISNHNGWGNNIYHNNLIDNTNQAYDNVPLWNNWDLGPRVGGNYWSDYTGLDDGSGGRTANDGIGDTLIPHPASSFDNYPLMDPWVEITGPDEAIEELIGDVENLGLPVGTETSLISKLEGAIAKYEDGNLIPALKMLNAFIGECEAQNGKKLTEAEADAMIATAQAIVGMIEDELYN